jgi:hypothetical protein
MTDTAPARAITKSVTIDRPTAEVHQYLADARNWPQWSVINVLAIDATSDPSWWQMTTPAGRASCASGPMPPPGCSITDFRDPQASWTVPARVVPKAAAPGSSSRSSSPHPMTRGVRRVARVHHPPGNGRAAGIPRGQRGRSRPAALYAGLMAAPPAPSSRAPARTAGGRPIPSVLRSRQRGSAGAGAAARAWLARRRPDPADVLPGSPAADRSWPPRWITA